MKYQTYLINTSSERSVPGRVCDSLETAVALAKELQEAFRLNGWDKNGWMASIALISADDEQ